MKSLSNRFFNLYQRAITQNVYNSEKGIIYLNSKLISLIGWIKIYIKNKTKDINLRKTAPKLILVHTAL